MIVKFDQLNCDKRRKAPKQTSLNAGWVPTGATLSPFFRGYVLSFRGHGAGTGNDMMDYLLLCGDL